MTTDILRLIMGDTVSAYHSDGLGPYNIARFLSIYPYMEFMPDTVYIGSVRDLDFLPELLLKKPTNIRLTLFIAMSSGEEISLLKAENTSIICSPLALPICIDLLHLAYEKYAQWLNDISLLSKSKNDNPLQQLTELASSIIPYTTVINGYGHNYIPEGVSIKPELLENILVASQAESGYSIINENNLCHILRLLPLNSTVCLRFFVLYIDPDNIIAIKQILNDIIDLLCHSPIFGNISAYCSSTKLASIFSDLMEHKLSDPAKLSELIQNSGLDKYSPCFIGMIGSSSSATIYTAAFFDELLAILPNVHIVQIGDYILLMLKCKDLRAQPEIDYTAMQALLEKHTLRLAFSYPMKSIIGLPVVCNQLSSTLRFAEIIRREGKGRIHFFHDYDIYHIIETCAKSDEYALHPTKLRYLIAPSFYLIAKYDQDYNTNLVATLRTYYQLGSNASETARELHYHRNTVIKKLEKIEQLLGEDINGTDLKWRMQIAFTIEDYITKFYKLPPDYGFITE